MKLPETYLIEVLRPEVKHILELLPKAQENKELQSYYNKLAQWGTQHLQKTGEIVLDKINLSYKDEVIKLGLVKRTKDLWGMINALIDLMKKHNLNKENIKIIQQTTLEILAGLSGIKDPRKQDPEPDPKPDPKSDPKSEQKPDTENGTGRDWTAYKAKKLANANGKPTSEVLKEFYDEYYSTEYAGVNPAKSQEIVAKLKSLDKILIPEFNKLGYNPEVNPFASFLKILIKEKFDIFKKLTYNNYGAIHNSFIEKYITGNMLGKKFDKTNILFCSDLYNKNGLDIMEYLHLQKQAQNAKENSEYADNAGLVAKIFIRQEQEDAAKSFTEKVQILLRLKLEANQVKLPGADDAKLRSLLEIQELYRHIFKDEAETTKKKVNLQTVVDIVDEAENQNVILDMIKLILAQNEYAGSAQYAEEAQKIDNWLNNRNYTPTEKGIAISRKILLKYTLNAKAFSLIINKLVQRINKPTENKK